MSTLEWTDKLALGLGPMDDTHREFVEDYNRLLALSGDALLAEMDVFIAHTLAHFEQENRWMELVGFPPCHKGEHDRVLAVVGDVRKRMERGDVALGRQLIQELPLWFDNHVASMDAALAAYLESIGFDTETGEIRNPPSTDACGNPVSAESCSCEPPAVAEAPAT